MIELRHGRVACSFLESARLQMARESWYSKDMQNLYCFLRMVTVSYLLIARHGFSTLLTPLAHDNRLGNRLQAIQILPFMTYTDIQVLESFTLRCLFPACYTPPPLSRFASHYWQG